MCILSIASLSLHPHLISDESFDLSSGRPCILSQLCIVVHLTGVHFSLRWSRGTDFFEAAIQGHCWNLQIVNASMEANDELSDLIISQIRQIVRLGQTKEVFRIVLVVRVIFFFRWKRSGGNDWFFGCRDSRSVVGRFLCD